MDTYRLKYFLRVAEEGSITGAAAVLGIAQPALSRHIRVLEEDLGVTLFRRTARGVQLTEDGEHLRAATAAPLRQLELAIQYAGSPLARIERGLRLGILPTAADLICAPILTGLATALPRVTVEVTVASTDSLLEEMLKGAIDIAFINPVADDRVFYRELVIEDLVLVGGPSSGLTPATPIQFTELSRLPLVLPSSATGIANTIHHAALRAKIEISGQYTTDSLQAAKALVAAGKGYAVLPRSAFIAEWGADMLSYTVFREPNLHQRIGLAATTQLELPRGLATKIGDVIRDDVGEMTRTNLWPATFVPSEQWNASLPT